MRRTPIVTDKRRRAPVKTALVLIAMASAGLSACQARPAAAPPPSTAAAAPKFTVAYANVQAFKPAFGRIDSVDAQAARARIGGTLTQMRVLEGAKVKSGEAIAQIADSRLPLQAQSESAQARALGAQLAQARADLDRFEQLHEDGFFPTQKLDQARALVRSLEDQVRAAQGQTAVTLEAGAQGAVLAPVSGTILRAPVRRGSVVMAGEEIALIGSAYIVKLFLPERHAAFLRAGGAAELEIGPHGERRAGHVDKIYPALADGRVEADISAPGLETRVFGERIRVWIPADNRNALIVPSDYLSIRYGIDFARILSKDGQIQDVVVRRGDAVATADIPDGVEILAGLNPGDVLVKP